MRKWFRGDLLHAVGALDESRAGAVEELDQLRLEAGERGAEGGRLPPDALQREPRQVRELRAAHGAGKIWFTFAANQDPEGGIPQAKISEPFRASPQGGLGL